MTRTVTFLLYSAAMSFAAGPSPNFQWPRDDKALLVRARMSPPQPASLFTPDRSLFGVGFGGGGGDWEPRLAGPISHNRLAGMAPFSLPDPAPWSLVPVAIAIFTVRHRAARSLLLLLLIFGLSCSILVPDHARGSRIFSPRSLSAN